MKKYMKPISEVMLIKVQPLMNNSVTDVSNLDGVSISSEDFVGGEADARGCLWDDDDSKD